MKLVKCVNGRDAIPKQLREGDSYYLDETTLCVIDGDEYAKIYLDKNRQKLIGFLLTSHFVEPEIYKDYTFTLAELSNVQNWLGHGVRIVFCSDENAPITTKIDMLNFKQIKKNFDHPENYRVFRIDALNDVICVYVIGDI